MIKTTVIIDGMMCNMCENHVNDAIRKKFPEIQSVRSRYKKGLTEIISERAYTKEELSLLLDESGYIVKEASSEQFTKRSFLFFGKR